MNKGEDVKREPTDKPDQCAEMQPISQSTTVTPGHEQEGTEIEDRPNMSKFKLEKLGLLPDELELALSSKVDFLVEKELPQRFRRRLDFAKESVLKNISIRPKLGNSDELDKRRASLDVYKHIVITYCTKGTKKELKIPDIDKALENAASPTGLSKIYGKQGIQSLSDVANDHYHKLQRSLMENLPVLLNQNPPYTNDDKNDYKRLCSILDNYTIHLLKFCTTISEETLSDTVSKLVAIFEECEAIVMLRIIVDWKKKNNIMTEGGWNTWRAHLSVIISFAAMMVVLLLALDLCSQYKIQDCLDDTLKNSLLRINKFYKTTNDSGRGVKQSKLNLISALGTCRVHHYFVLLCVLYFIYLTLIYN